jgi:hypothetical protein
VKRLALPFAYVAVALLAGMLAACGTWPGLQQAPVANAETSAVEGSGSGSGAGRAYDYGSGRLAMGDMTGDRQAMCELNRRMRTARTPEARQAVTDKYMGTMSPESRHHLLQMMREQCR